MVENRVEKAGRTPSLTHRLPSAAKPEEIAAILLAILLVAALLPWASLLRPFTGLAIAVGTESVEIPLASASVNDQPLADALAKTLSASDDGGIEVVTGASQNAVVELAFSKP